MSTAPCGQLLVLIGSDGRRASVSRAIATEASYVLRDLLDGYDVLTRALRERASSSSSSCAATCTDANVAAAAAAAAPAPSDDLPDLLDFGTTSNGDAATTTTTAAAVQHDEASATAAPTAAADDGNGDEYGGDANVIELPFPYFTGDILERVCAHMTYRFRVSTFGAEGGQCQVYPVRMRDIARPMLLPLSEYLDAANRRCVADWDEKTTVWMVKAATLLNYDELLQLASAKLASHLAEKSLDGVRILLGVKNDFAPAEEAELQKEHVVNTSK